MRRHLVLAVAAVAMASLAWAGPRPFRTRAADDLAWQLIESALARSETVRQLAHDLERSDLIVIVQVCRVPAPALGDTRVMSADAGTRYLRIRVSAAASLADQLVVLGHELRHAVEIAQAPEVRDAEGQLELGRRIGWTHGTGLCYETEAAIRAGEAVRAELRGRETR